MTDTPEGWKTYDEFAAGIATNRLPGTDALAGRRLDIALAGGRRRLMLEPAAGNRMTWSDGGRSGEDWYEAILVAPDVYFLDLTFAAMPAEAETLIVNTAGRRVLSVRSVVQPEGSHAGQPRVRQVFSPGVLDPEKGAPHGPEPAPTRDLVGLRTFNVYSPNHTYEHTYLSSERYAWQCLRGVQRGHGDVDLATTYRFDDDLYLFTFREFVIPVASVFFYNFKDMRSTGKFLGITGDGAVENSPAGAFLQKASMTFYAKDSEPV